MLAGGGFIGNHPTKVAFESLALIACENPALRPVASEVREAVQTRRDHPWRKLRD